MLCYVVRLQRISKHCGDYWSFILPWTVYSGFMPRSIACLKRVPKSRNESVEWKTGDFSISLSSIVIFYCYSDVGTRRRTYSGEQVEEWYSGIKESYISTTKGALCVTGDWRHAYLWRAGFSLLKWFFSHRSLLAHYFLLTSRKSASEGGGAAEWKISG